MIKKTKRSKNKNKTCYFTEVGKEPDYKDVLVLKRFVTDRQKILHHTYSGLTARNQRKLSKALKMARYMALIPFTDKHDI